MADLYWIPRSRLARIAPFLSAFAQGAAGGCPSGGPRHPARDPQRSAPPRRSGGGRGAQDTRQPLCALEPVRPVYRIFAGLAEEAGEPDRLMIDATSHTKYLAYVPVYDLGITYTMYRHGVAGRDCGCCVMLAA